MWPVFSYKQRMNLSSINYFHREVMLNDPSKTAIVIAKCTNLPFVQL